MSTHQDDLSPASRPFTARINEWSGRDDQQFFPIAAGLRVARSADLAKRLLLELRVRDFTAADVVALAALIEARDRSAA